MRFVLSVPSLLDDQIELGGVCSILLLSFYRESWRGVPISLVRNPLYLPLRYLCKLLVSEKRMLFVPPSFG